MVRNWHYKIKADKSVIIDFLDYFLKEYEEAKLEVLMPRGEYIDRELQKLPGMYETRFSQLQEIEAVLESLENEMRQLRSTKVKEFMENYNRDMNINEAGKYIDGEPEVYDLYEIINEVAFVRNMFISITKGYDAKQWNMGHIAKLRTSGIEDATFS